MLAITEWPQAPFTRSLCRNALAALGISVIELSQLPSAVQEGVKCLLWASYDAIDHELVHSRPELILASSYTIRKALIRKHFLANIVHSRCTKHPDSILVSAVPKTYQFELAFADELDELFADDLWELGESLSHGLSWWILKPGMADRGNGLRLFRTREQLEDIFQGFEQSESSDESQDQTNVITSQLRHFVIQQYISNPLLIEPKDSSTTSRPTGTKFHLRVYAVASGALSVYILRHILALFAATPYADPIDEDVQSLNLGGHLTNTSLQMSQGDENVYLLDELIGHPIIPQGFEEPFKTLTKDDVQSIVQQVTLILEETFRAALEFPTHFQAVPNAFEMFGVDFLVASKSGTPAVQILEINAEPAIELTGSRVGWILQELFNAIGKLHVERFSADSWSSFHIDDWAVGEERDGLIKCCDVDMKR